MKKVIVLLGICLCTFLICSGCEKKTEEQTIGKDGEVSMSATVTEDDNTTLKCTIVNKTSKDITIGEEYSLQVLKDESFVDVPLSPDAGSFNLESIDVSAGEEYTYRAYIGANYGDLEAGHYRIVKEYTNKGDDSQSEDNADKETVAAEFDL